MKLEHKTLILRLEHTPNPDIHGGYWEAPIDPKKDTREVATLAEARKHFREWIERNGLGGGNMTKRSGEVTEGGKVVGRFSYNGRFWLPDGTEGKVESAELDAEPETLVLFVCGDEVAKRPHIVRGKDDIEQLRLQAADHGGGEWTTLEIPLAHVLAVAQAIAAMKALYAVCPFTEQSMPALMAASDAMRSIGGLESIRQLLRPEAPTPAKS